MNSAIAEDTAILSTHLEDTVRSIAELPADPQAIFEAIQETHSEMIAQDGIVAYRSKQHLKAKESC